MQEKSKNQLKFTGKPQKYMCFAITLFILLVSNTLGQSITWQRTYDGMYHGFDVAEDICDAGNGNFFIVGTSQRPNSYSSIFVLKINSYGDTIWTRYIDTASGKAVTPSGDGGCVITGLKGSAFTTKIDSNGNTVWFKKYTGNIVFIGYDIVKTNDNGYLLCGSAYYDSAYLCKIDSIGDMKWHRFYTAGYRKNFRKIIEGINGGYIIAGYLNNLPIDTTRGLVAKIDTLGNIENERTFVLNGNTGVYDIDRIDNNYVLAGDVYDGNNFRVFLKRIDINLNDIYTKIFISDDNETTSRLKIIDNNKYVVSMSRLTNSFPFRYYSKLIITDSSGNISNERFYDAMGDMNIYSILPMVNGDIMFVGYAEFYTFPIEADVYALRTDSLLDAPPPIGIEIMNYSLPSKFSLNSFPNPFNPSITIKFKIPEESKIRITIYDIQGKEVERLVYDDKNPGIYEVVWFAENLSSGVYFLTLYSDKNIFITKKIVLLK